MKMCVLIRMFQYRGYIYIHHDRLEQVLNHSLTMIAHKNATFHSKRIRKRNFHSKLKKNVSEYELFHILTSY
jgi:hypothetical protein